MSVESTLHTTQVDLGGLLAVLGESLYSTPEVAIRELVQNAHDACTRRRLEDPAVPAEPWILLTADAKRGTLTLEDPGAGLTREEILRYLATIGAGYTRKLRAETQDPSLIGMFGLGFLSAYVVAERISLHTTSYQEPERGWLFGSRSGARFTVEEAAPRAVGTEIVLTLKPRFAALAELEVLRRVVERYACLLPVPVHIGSRDAPAANAEPPPWRTQGATEAARRRFAARFEPSFAPLALLEVTPTKPGAPRGTLWIQDGASYATSDNRNVSVFVRGMLITSDGRDLLPRWAGFVGGVLECDALSPTASREDLMEDAAFAEARHEVGEALVRGLTALSTQNPALWRAVLLRHNEALLGACLAEPRLFEAIAEQLVLPTSEGELSAAEIRRRGHGKLHATLSPQGGYEEVLFRALKVPIALGTRFAVLPFLRRYAETRGGAVIELGTSAGDRSLFPPAPLAPEAQAWLEAELARPGQRLVPTRFRPPELPLVLVPDREAELKARVEADEADRRIGGALLRLARLHTQTIDGEVRARLYVNLDAPVIAALLEARADPARAEAVRRAARMLHVLVALITGPSPETAGVEYARTLAEYAELVRAALEGA